MSKSAPKWPPEQIEALRTMARERGLSASEIARALAAQFGTVRSRNAVLGKLLRLGQTRPPTPKWLPEHVEALRTLACEQKLSTSKIARALAAQFGVAYSHTAVLNRLYRLREEGVPLPRTPRQKTLQRIKKPLRQWPQTSAIKRRKRKIRHVEVDDLVREIESLERLGQFRADALIDALEEVSTAATTRKPAPFIR
jgi:hypothetical protein